MQQPLGHRWCPQPRPQGPRRHAHVWLRSLPSRLSRPQRSARQRDGKGGARSDKRILQRGCKLPCKPGGGTRVCSAQRASQLHAPRDCPAQRVAQYGMTCVRTRRRGGKHSKMRRKQKLPCAAYPLSACRCFGTHWRNICAPWAVTPSLDGEYLAPRVIRHAAGQEPLAEPSSFSKAALLRAASAAPPRARLARPGVLHAPPPRPRLAPTGAAAALPRPKRPPLSEPMSALARASSAAAAPCGAPCGAGGSPTMRQPAARA